MGNVSEEMKTLQVPAIKNTLTEMSNALFGL